MSKRHRANVDSIQLRKATSDTAIEQANAAALNPITDAIEAERGRLMNAEAILHCTVLAMNEHDCADPDGPYFQNIVDVARDLVRQSINGLDSVRLYRSGITTPPDERP
jgi:hypothetical protein